MKFKLGQKVVVLADWSELKGQIGCYVAEVRDDESLYLIKWQGHSMSEYNACLCSSEELAPFEGTKAPKEQPVNDACFSKMDVRSQYRAVVESTMSCMIALQKLLEDGSVNFDKVFEHEGYPFYRLADYVYDMVMDYENTRCGTAPYEDNFENDSKLYYTERLNKELGDSEIIPVTVYRDTVEEYDESTGDENLTDIDVPKNRLYSWFRKNILEDFRPDSDEGVSDYGLFEEWLDEYTADDTQTLYDDMKQYISA